VAVLTTQTISQAGLGVTEVAAGAGGDKFTPGSSTLLQVKNASGGSINVTVDSQKTCDQGFDHNLVVAVPAGATRLIGPFPGKRFVGADKKVSVAYSAVTSVTVAVIQS
jgi:hypothetical protein